MSHMSPTTDRATTINTHNTLVCVQYNNNNNHHLHRRSCRQCHRGRHGHCCVEFDGLDRAHGRRVIVSLSALLQCSELELQPAILLLQRSRVQELVDAQVTKLLDPRRIDRVQVAPQLHAALARMERQQVVSVRMLRVERIQERHSVAVDVAPHRRRVLRHAVLNAVSFGVEQKRAKSP